MRTHHPLVKGGENDRKRKSKFLAKKHTDPDRVYISSPAQIKALYKLLQCLLCLDEICNVKMKAVLNRCGDGIGFVVYFFRLKLPSSVSLLRTTIGVRDF